MNLKKKIVALGMVCALAVSMATSAFAVEVSTRGGSWGIVLTGYGYALTPDENSRTMYWQTADYGVGSKQYWNKEYS